MAIDYHWANDTFLLLQKTKKVELMYNLLTEYKIGIGIFAICFLFAINYNVLFLGLDNDFFGIVFSAFLFFFGSRKTNFKINYLLIALIFVLEFVSYRLHTQSLHFLSLILFLCLIFYSFTGKFSFVAFICILLFSTIFNKFFEHLTSEIKQGLCYAVFLTLKNFMTLDRIEGVNFYSNNTKITIDTACMGLSMFKTGLLTGAILLTLEEKKQKKYFGIIPIVTFCFVVVALNIISNYFRIVTLVILGCTQENTLHHLVGLLCFGLYQVIPMVFIINYFKPKMTEIEVANFQSKSIPIILTFVILFITSLEIKSPKKDHLLTNLNPEYNIKNGIWVNDEVFKIATSNKLIYIKTASHKPLICWTGNGYTITESKEILVKNEKIWFNKMEKNDIKYKSLWWYECGGKKYTSFLEVMFMKLIYNQPIRLINVTSRL
ncbi:exosortase N [Flavobacterium sp. SOK18b]|uniref:exosortase N n=1 Tax=Flavobacterium sp. SOK18b TaxID=797900 RepID=UPI001EC43ECC|nr:exosortase N [Flavobacterium sp. SOK18b]